MARQVTVKHIRKAGAFGTSELAAGEIGVNTTDSRLEFSADGSAIVRTGNMVSVDHGSTAGTARPAGGSAIKVIWYGTVEPTNALTNDLWVNTT